MVKARTFFAKVAMVEGNISRLQTNGANRELSSVWAYVVSDEVPIYARPRCPFRLEARHGHEPELFHGCLVDVFSLKLLHENAQGLQKVRLLLVYLVLNRILEFLCVDWSI